MHAAITLRHRKQQANGNTMSRSNPTESIKNPSTRWFEWNGQAGVVKYYDKKAKDKNGELGANVAVPLPFTFIYLDSLSGVGGFNKGSNASIYSNEIRDTRYDAMDVRVQGGQTIALGLYADIKERVKAFGGKFTKSIYIAFKDGTGALQIGCLRLKGAALGSWSEFYDVNQKAIEQGSNAVCISGTEDGKNGSVIYKTPVFSLREISEPSAAAAMELDTKLQTFLSGYLARSAQQTARVVQPHATGDQTPMHDEPPIDSDPPVEAQHNPADEEGPGGW
jgi:hypothetical protein